MLLVKPKLLYFGIAGHFCALAWFHKPSTGKGPCKWEGQLTFGFFESHKAML
jgi:hypothetical protein